MRTDMDAASSSSTTRVAAATSTGLLEVSPEDSTATFSNPAAPDSSDPIRPAYSYTASAISSATSGNDFWSILTRVARDSS